MTSSPLFIKQNNSKKVLLPCELTEIGYAYIKMPSVLGDCSITVVVMTCYFFLFYNCWWDHISSPAQGTVFVPGN